jgi:hypothetical protein
MKNLLKHFTFICFLFIPILLKAQCTSCTSNVAGGGSAITVNSGETICVTSGTTQSGNIIVQGGGKICFASGITVTSNFTINNMDNNTAIIVQSGATISNTGNINFNGSLTGGIIDNRGTWLKDNITLFTNLTFNNSGSFGLSGTRLNMTMNSGSSFINTGQVFINNFNFNTGATFTSNAGNVSVAGSPSLSGAMNITGGSIAFLGNLTVNSSASLITQPNTSFSVAGAVSNNSTLTIGSSPATIGGSVTNNSSGTMTVNNTILTVGGAFSNNGAILASGSCGRINIAGGSVQNSSGSVGALADICDTSATAPNLFDSQAGTVSPMATKCLCMPTPLPVTWLYVEASLGQSNVVHIKWATIEEYNNKKFVVERSDDSHEWEIIATMSGTNTLQPKHYSFVDNAPLPSANYYRIKQIDFDGKYTTSKIVVVNNTEGELTVYPNPFSDSFSWVLKTSTDDIILVQLLSIDGHIIVQTTEKGFNGKINTVDTKDLASGIYILQVITKEKSWVQKLTKL